MNRNLRIVAWGCILALLMLMGPAVSRAQEIEWLRQFSGGWFTLNMGVASDASGVYVVTGPNWAYGGSTSICKYDSTGTQLWCHDLFGGWSFNYGNGVATGDSGVYVVGATSGAFPGQTNAGESDAFVCKYDPNGTQVWCRQFGTSTGDVAWAVATDPSGVYVAGQTWGVLPGQTSDVLGRPDCFVCKYDADGTQLWCHQFGATGGVGGANAVATNPSGVYVAGNTWLPLPGRVYPGPFVCKYDANGTQVWCREFGPTGIDEATGVATDPSGVYVGGFTFGTFPGQTGSGWWDNFLCKYDTSGNQSWCRQLGASTRTRTVAATDPSAVYVAGSGNLPGQTNAGEAEVFVCKYDTSGTQLSCLQFGSTAPDYAYGMASGASGVYLVGGTFGSLPGQTHSAGWEDPFLAKVRTLTNQPPVSAAGADRTAIATEALAFDGSASSDPDGSIASYAWDFGDGYTSSDAVTTHAFAAAGSYTVTLMVTDDVGATGTDTAVITVKTVSDAIGSLSGVVASFNLRQGIANSLDAKLENAMDAYQAANAGNRQDVVNKLMAFINAVEAQRGKELTSVQADQLIAEANRILSVL